MLHQLKRAIAARVNYSFVNEKESILKRKAALEAELCFLEAEREVCEAESELNSLLSELELCRPKTSSSSSDS